MEAISYTFSQTIVESVNAETEYIHIFAKLSWIWSLKRPHTVYDIQQYFKDSVYQDT